MAESGGVGSSSSSSSVGSNGSNGSSSASSSSNSSSSDSQTTSESLQSSPTTAESLASSPTTADTLSGGSSNGGSSSDSDSDNGNSNANSNNEKNGSAQRSNDTRASDALSSISKDLDQSGVFNDVTHSELNNINSTLSQLPPEQTNQVIAGLSDQQLSTWTDEIDSNGILGTGGLDEVARSSLFDNLASDLDMNQLGRMHNAIDDTDTREEFTESISRDKSTNDVRTAINDRVGSLQAGEAVSNLNALDGDLATMQNAQTMAKFSSDSYQDYATAAGPNALEPGTTRLNPDQLPPELNIQKEHLVHDASGFHAAVYQKGQGADATYTVAFRGTEDGTDWKTNIASGVGFETTQFKMADELVSRLTLSVGSENVTVTGHSLGGGLANYSAMKNEVYSTTFNPKGTTSKEQQEIGDVDAMAAKFIQNYQVNGEVLTGAQEIISDNLLKPVPGPTTDLPAIRPDGKEGNMFLEAAQDGLMKVSPWHDSADLDISGPVDRHGMDYVLRGMDVLIDRTEAKALDQLFQAQN